MRMCETKRNVTENTKKIFELNWPEQRGTKRPKPFNDLRIESEIERNLAGECKSISRKV